MLRITLLCVLVYFLNIFLFIECKDAEIAVSLFNANNSQCTVSNNNLTLQEYEFVFVNVTSDIYMHHISIKLPEDANYHFFSKGGETATTAIGTHSQLKGKWTFLIQFNPSTVNNKLKKDYLEATCSITVNIEPKPVKNDTAHNKTDVKDCQGCPLSYLPEWLPVPVLSLFAVCVVIIILQIVLIVHFKRKARDALPYNSLVKRSVEDIDSAVRYSSHPFQKKNVALPNRGSRVYEDPNISFANGRPPPTGPPPNIPIPNGLPPSTGPPNIPVPNIPRQHLDITKTMLPVMPRTESIPKLNTARTLNTQLVGSSAPMDETSIAHRPPLPLPTEEFYETMEADLPEDYDDPQTLEWPPKQPPPKTVAASPKSNRTAKKPKPMLPPPEKSVKAAKAPMVNELNAALKQRAANAGISQQVPQKPMKTITPKSPNPILSPPPVRHKPKTTPTPKQNPQGFEEASQLRLRPKPVALLPTEQRTPLVSRKPPVKVPDTEAIYNETEGHSDSEERWEYEALKPNRFYLN